MKATEKARNELLHTANGAVWLTGLELSRYVKFSSVSKDYFGKSANWILQRLHGYDVNGKPAQFKPEELRTLADALTDVARKIDEAAKLLTTHTTNQ